MNKILVFLAIVLALSSCGRSNRDWFDEYGKTAPSTPYQMQYGSYYGMTAQTNTSGAHRMAVLLPTSGTNASAGRAIRTAIETAVLQHAPQNLTVSFYDTAPNAPMAINQALASEPEIIIGPLFANNARMLRNVKPNDLPVIAFTTDAKSVGNGVMSISLMPTNSTEAIVGEMRRDGVTGTIIIAPDTESGAILAGVARDALGINDITISGIFYYKERDTDSIKNTAMNATINSARTAANTRARAILSDILNRENLTAIERSSLNKQLKKLSEKDTLGKLPYDSILFLGSGDDTKSLASFFRYYGVSAGDAKFYGTAQWDGSDIASDITMTGAKFATLPEMKEGFANLYERVSGESPTRLASFGYDATNIAIGMLYTNKSNAAYLLDPSGYIGIDGLVRLRPSGENERGLRIVQLNGSGTFQTLRDAPTNFITPIYNIEQHKSTPARAMELDTAGINPLNYIQIPDRLRSKYKSKTYGAHTEPASARVAHESTVVYVPTDTSDAIENPEYAPVKLEQVNRTYIDSVEIEE